MMKDINTYITEAIHDGKLGSTVESLLADDHKYISVKAVHLLHKARVACSNIRNQCMTEGHEICHRLKSAGVNATFDDANAQFRPQFHQFHISISDNDPTNAVTIATQMGYRSRISHTGAEWEVFRRTKSQMTLTKRDDVTMRMVLKWPSQRLRLHFFWPSVADTRLIPLPTRLWPLAFIVRPFHILLRKTGLIRKPTSIGFFLGTPHQLIPHLLDFVDVCKDDVLLDLGCGDGRVVVEAARLYGCKAIGYELDGNLCKIARDSALRNEVDHLVQIQHADAHSAPVEAATVVFLFLPPQMMCRTLPKLIDRLPAGCRIIAHEQLRLKCPPPPLKSLPLIAYSALTVAHLWRLPS